MSIWNESSDDRRARERKEQHDYEMDVMYEVWRSGGNPDAVDYDRVRDHYHESWSVDSSASAELKRQRPPPQPQPEYEPSPEDYPEENQDECA